MAYRLISLCWKMWVAFASAKDFFSKNTCESDIVLTRMVNILATNKLVNLTMLWITGPWMKGASRKLFFLFLHENIYCGYSLELPYWCASNEYPKYMFLWRNKKDIYTFCLKEDGALSGAIIIFLKKWKKNLLTWKPYIVICLQQYYHCFRYVLSCSVIISVNSNLIFFFFPRK